MAQDRTSGFDVLVQITETEINNQLATQFLAGQSPIPSSIDVPINTGGIIGIATLNFPVPPVADLDRPRPQMGITIPFENSQIQFTSPAPLVLSPISGTITIVDSIEVITEGSNEIVTLDFINGANVTVVLNPSSAVTTLLALSGMTLVQVQNLMAGMVLTELQTNIGRIDLSTPIPIIDDADPTTVFDIKVTTINDNSSADRDCVALGIRMSSETGGNINNVTTNYIPSDAPSIVMMSNFWLLAKVMRPRVASSLGLQISDFDTPLRLNHNVPAPGGRGTLTRMEARVEGNRIRVDGSATDSGTGWSAVSNFTFFIDITLAADGNIHIIASTPTVDTDVDLEWWVWLLGLGLGGLFGGIVGAIIAAIVLAVIEAVAESIVNNLVAGGISGALGNIPTIPLGPIGSGLQLSNILLDDLELRSSIIHSVVVPIKSQGSYSSLSGFTIDLDTGLIGTSINYNTDLIWNPRRGLSTNYPVGLTITGLNYGVLSPVQVSRLPLTGTLIPLNQIPLSNSINWPFLPHSEVVFGLRTSKGRYAKIRAWLSVLDLRELHIEWVTYDTPIPQLDIAARWSIVERGEVTEYITPDCSYCRSNSVSWCGVFEAQPRLMAFPIDYQWCLCGTVIEEGDGEIPSKTGPLAYRLKGKRLCIKTEMGQDVDCELCVSAIDSRNQELFTCIRLNKPGIEKRCKKCESVRYYKTEFLSLPEGKLSIYKQPKLMEYLTVVESESLK